MEFELLSPWPCNPSSDCVKCKRHCGSTHNPSTLFMVFNVTYIVYEGPKLDA